MAPAQTPEFKVQHSTEQPEAHPADAVELPEAAPVQAEQNAETVPADAVPVPEAPVAQAEQNAETVAAESVQAALAAIDQANPSVVRDEPADDVDPDPPVYDERGNVRPRGTPGARPMTKAERTKIAQALARGEAIVTTAEKRPSK